jgi:E3 ubiquitin ligase
MGRIRHSIVSLTLIVWAFALVSSLHTHSRTRSETVIATRLGIVLLAVLGLIVGIEMFFSGFGALRRKRLIENTPTSTVRGAAMGQVELCGKIVGPYTLISPLSLLDCYFYEARAWQSEGSGERRRWKNAGQETLCTPFFVEDATGRMLVDPRGAEIDVPKDFDEAGPLDAMPESVRRFAARRGMSAWCDAKLEEYCIKPGDTLFVLGTVSEDPQSTNLSESQPAGTVPDGFLSEAAADLQRRSVLDAMNEALPDYRQARTAVTSEFEVNPLVVLRKGSEPFFISTRSQREVIGTLAWTSTLSIWGGPVLAMSSLAVLLQRLGWW